MVSPYFSQVKQIRQALRAKGRSDLRRVVVERITNMQGKAANDICCLISSLNLNLNLIFFILGKEFRAIFISTVRTVHLTSKRARKASDSGWFDDSHNEDIDSADFGFLSDQRMLNTAMTRAQSMVGIVGDPVALCAIGSCANVWRAFLKHCSQMQSIVPAEVTFHDIKAQVRENINPHPFSLYL